MEIHVYNSGSAGNLYRVDDLLLEAGVSIQKIKAALNFRLSEIAGCLVTHEHGDHAKGAENLLKAGIDLYCSGGTAHSLGLSGHRLHVLQAGKQISIGSWKVLPFAVVHDAEEPLGFLIGKGSEKLLFATDTNYIPSRFKGLTHIMLGVDYDSEILKENVANGNLHGDVGKRVLKNHMSLETAKGFFLANDMSKVQEIYLLHLSSQNATEGFKEEIERITGKPVYLS